MSDTEENQVPPPPAEIVVPEMDEPMVYVQLTKQEYSNLLRDIAQLQEAVTRMASLIDASATKISQLAVANNSIVTAIRGLPTNQQLIDAVAAEVVSLVEVGENRIEDQVAETIYRHHLERLFEKPEEVADLVNTYEAVYEVQEEELTDNHEVESDNENCLLHIKKYDEVLGDYVVADPQDPRDKIIFKAIMRYMQDNTVEPEEILYFRHHEKPMEPPATAETFDKFMESAMPKEGQSGNTWTTTSVAREYFDNAAKVIFHEREESDENVGYIDFYTRVNDNWEQTPIDSELAMYYISLIQSQGGQPGEEWYISHQ